MSAHHMFQSDPTSCMTPQRIEPRQMATILGALPDACYVFDRDGRCVYGNHAAERFLGASRERFLGALVWDILPDPDGTLHDLHLRALINWHPISSAIYAPWLGCWFDVALQPVSGDMLVVMAHQCLGWQESRHVAAELASAPALPTDGAGRDVFWIIDPRSQRIHYVSPSYDMIWGQSHYPLYHSASRWMQVVHRDDLERVRTAFSRAMESGVYDVEYQIVRPDGAVRWVHDRAFRAMGRGAGLGFLFRIAEDVTSRKRADAERASLVEQERRSRAAADHTLGQLDALHDMIAVLGDASTPAGVLDALLGVALGSLGAYAGAVLAPQGERAALAVSSVQGGFPELWPAHDAPARHPLLDAAEQRRALFCEPGAWAERYPALYERCGAHVGSWAAIPLLLHGQVAAVIGLAFTYGRDLDDSDRRYLDILAQQGGHALERVRLHQDAREAISQSDAAWARLESVVHTAPVGLAIWDADLRYVHINPALAALNQRSVEEHIGHTIRELFPELPPQIDATIERVLRTGQPLLNYELRDFFPAQPEGAWLLSLFPIRLPSGAIAGVGAIVMDITARKRAEAMLALMAEMTGELTQALTPAAVTDVIKEHLDQAFGIKAIWVMLLSDDGEWLELERAYGYPEQLVDQWRRIHRSAQLPLARAVALGEPVWVETLDARVLGYPSVAASDTTNLGTLAAIPLVVNGQSIGCLGLRFRDYGDIPQEDRKFLYTLTRYYAQALERARLHEAERAARAEAEAAVAIRDQFLSVAAHELKTPLTSLLGTAQILHRSMKRRDDLAERDLWAMQVIQDQSRRLHQMILMMLDISRIQQGQLAIIRAPVDLVELARRVLREMRLLQEHYELHLEIMADEPLVVDGDELRLEQVLQNLLQNAIKYSPSGGEILVQLEHTGAFAQIVVCDQGIGIPADAMPHLFDRFYRAENADRFQIGGLGIGLYVVHEIVRLHGGEVLIASAEGEGSTFTVRLPLRQRERAAAAGATA